MDVARVMSNCTALHAGCSQGTIGQDVAGIVEAVGENCGLTTGMEVWGVVNGSYANYALGDCTLVRQKPLYLGFGDAGTVPTVGLTSLQSLLRIGAPWTSYQNKTVVVANGESGTGIMAVQLAKVLGAGRVITDATGAAADMSFFLGADVVVDDLFDYFSWANLSGHVDVFFDNRGVSAKKALQTLREGGTYLLLPGLGGSLTEPQDGKTQIQFGPLEPEGFQLDVLALWFDAGELVTKVNRTVDLRGVRDAFSVSLHPDLVGIIAVQPDPEDQVEVKEV